MRGLCGAVRHMLLRWQRRPAAGNEERVGRVLVVCRLARAHASCSGTWISLHNVCCCPLPACLFLHRRAHQVVLMEDRVQRRQALDVLLSYNPFWLRLAAEVVTQKPLQQQLADSDAEAPRGTFFESMRCFLLTHLLSDAEMHAEMQAGRGAAHYDMEQYMVRRRAARLFVRAVCGGKRGGGVGGACLLDMGSNAIRGPTMPFISTLSHQPCAASARSCCDIQTRGLPLLSCLSAA